MVNNSATRDEDTPNVGQRIRLLRDAQHLSLRALADKCGLSMNAISRIERGENSPTVASLQLLATALNVPVTEFFRTASEQKTVYVKHDSRMRSQYSRMAVESLGIGLHNQRLEPFLVTLQPGAGADTKPITHNGQEFVYCVEGQVEYQVSGDRFTLSQGDSLLFEAAQPHAFRNNTDVPAVILMVFHVHDGDRSASQNHLNT